MILILNHYFKTNESINENEDIDQVLYKWLLRKLKATVLIMNYIELYWDEKLTSLTLEWNVS